ncbi:MAG: hypothetical protein ACR2MM_13340 [Flavobacteriaceae bacterium]
MKPVLFWLVLILSYSVYSQTEEIFDDISLGDSLEIVAKKLKPLAGTLYEKRVNQPNFPLAKQTEVHLICLDCKTTNGFIEEVAFTFADDKLCLIQAKGNAVKAITEQRKDTADVFMNYAAYWEDLIVTDQIQDKVWIMSPEAAHPNLFAWDNPFLPAFGGVETSYNSSAAIPDFIEMGADLEKMQPLLKEASTFTYSRKLGPDDPNAQLQIDCFGIEYAGFPRKFEARFGDGKLNMIWILTGKGEEDRIRQKLIEAYGSPIYRNEAWEVFKEWEVFLRKDKPEVLLLTAELGAFYKKDYFKQE